MGVSATPQSYSSSSSWVIFYWGLFWLAFDIYKMVRGFYLRDLACLILCTVCWQGDGVIFCCWLMRDWILLRDSCLELFLLLPIQLWDKMIKQIEDTLNMLRTWRTNSKKSAYQELEGKFDQNKTPLAQWGTKGMVLIHPSNRNTFDSHCNDGFIIGRTPHHYRLLEFYIPARRGYV